MEADSLAEQDAPDERKKWDLRTQWAKSPLLSVPKQGLQRIRKPYLLDPLKGGCFRLIFLQARSSVEEEGPGRMGREV